MQIASYAVTELKEKYFVENTHYDLKTSISLNDKNAVDKNVYI